MARQKTQLCINDVSCVNPDNTRRPTKLTGPAESESRASGICSYCREAGRHSIKEITSTTLALLAPEWKDPTFFPNEVPVDDGEYDKFSTEDVKSESEATPLIETPSSIAKKEASIIHAAVRNKEEHVTRHNPGEVDLNDLEVENVDTDSRDGSAKPSKEKKMVEPTEQIGHPNVQNAVPADTINKGINNIKNVPSPQLRGARKKEVTKETYKKASERSSTKTPPVSDSTMTLVTATATQMPEMSGFGKNTDRNISERRPDLASRDWVRHTSAKINQILPTKEVDFSNKNIDIQPQPPETQRPMDGRKVLRHLYAGVHGVVSSIVDQATTAGRFFVGGTVLYTTPFITAGLFLTAGILRQSKLASIVLKGGVNLFKKTFKWTVAPLIDGRIVPSASIGLTILGSNATKLGLGTPMAGAAMIAGPVLFASWAMYRTIKGFVTGEAEPINKSIFSNFNIFKKSVTPSLIESYRNPKWVKTDNLSSIEKARLNDEFERVVAHALTVVGFRAEVHGTQGNRADGRTGPGDGGVDVTISDSHGRRTLVSCKRYAGKVDEKEVRDIFAVASSGNFKGSGAMLVTTNGFTKGAQQFAAQNGVYLITLDQLIEKASKLSA